MKKHNLPLAIIVLFGLVVLGVGVATGSPLIFNFKNSYLILIKLILVIHLQIYFISVN